MSKNDITPGEWIYWPGEDGDDSVGMDGESPSVGVQHIGEPVEICTLRNPRAYVDREPVDEFDECVEQLGTADGNGRLIAASPDLLDEVVRFHANIEADVDDMTCDAGNWDGGSSESCEHCQAIKYRDRLAALIAKATGGPPP